MVTGGGSGIGAATAASLAEAGASVIGRRPEPMQTIAREVGGVLVVAGVTEADAPRRVVDTAGPLRRGTAVDVGTLAFGQ